MENLEVGDILLTSGGKEREVLAVLDKVVVLDDGDGDEYTDTLRIDRLEKEGYSIKTEEVLEVTVAEVSKKFGKTVKIVE